MFSDPKVKKEPGFYLINNIGMYKERMGLSEKWLFNDRSISSIMDYS